ncbi:MAG: Holliday junction resolvase RuvX [Porticoccaceae bacterium]|nr:Holliday junction resolvase RuvX [Pseudomonadales bacterium]MCP5173062.1 Holliday junction resolvase RuvX [Pseudomonadales bacterium]MCP5302536.1 Holliday junction resolvase RuvX [Pseudomonadales bacterium]
MPELHAKPLTLLAFDFGTGQIGVAIGQTLTNSARPLNVLKAQNGIPDWNQISQLLDEWQPQKVLVGLPLNMDGSESPFCARARKFARRLHGRFGIAVEMMDERLSSFEAKQQTGQHHDFLNNPIDDTAASLILESWLQDPTAGKPV